MIQSYVESTKKERSNGNYTLSGIILWLIQGIHPIGYNTQKEVQPNDCTSFKYSRSLLFPRYSNPRSGRFDRIVRKGQFLRFAIVNVHRTFISPLRSRRLRRCRCLTWDLVGLHQDCHLGSRRHPCYWDRSLRHLADRPAAVPGTFPVKRPAMQR